MDLHALHWGSPVGLGVFLAGLGAWFYLFFNGLAALKRVEHLERSGKPESYGFPVAKVKHVPAEKDSEAH